MGDFKDQGPAAFVDASMKKSKSNPDSRYAWSKTFDMREIEKQLGTSIVTVTILKPKKAESEDDRLMIFKPSDAKYLPKRKDGSKGGSAPARRSNNEVEL